MTKYSVTALLAATILVPILGGALSAAAPPGGTISVEPRTADGDYDPSMPSFVNAVGEALAGKGFTILEDSGHAAYIAELILSRVEVGTGSVKVQAGRADIMPGGVPGAAGVGVTIPLSTGKSTLVPLQRTRLEVRVRKRGGEGVLWDGAAVTVRTTGTPKGADDAVASDLGEAVLRNYPAQPQQVIGVP